MTSFLLAFRSRNRLIEDYEHHQQVAVSLANDIAARGSPALRAALDKQPDPIYAAIEAHEKAYAVVRAACAESNRLCQLADDVAGKHVVAIPDLRTADAIALDPHAGLFALPVAYEQHGIKFFEAPTSRFVDMYLPGDENEQLRRGFYQRLKDLEKAREAVYGDIDKVVEGPASDECDAVDELVDVVPTTLAGLLSFLIHLRKAHSRDPDMFSEDHLEPLIEGLGKAAARRSVGQQASHSVRHDVGNMSASARRQRHARKA
jgi:hypothetical protein